MKKNAEQEATTRPKDGLAATTNVRTHLLIPLRGSDGLNFVSVSAIHRMNSRFPNDKTRPGEVHTLPPED